MNALVSVIIPTYNRRDDIFRALESVFEQEYRPVEIIIVDDCSTDGTIERLAEVEFSVPVQVIRLPINQGAGAARNIAMAAATGKYIAFLDSDDHWLPNKLAREIPILENRSQNTVLFSEAYIRRKYDIVIRPRRANRIGEALQEYLFVHGEQIALCSVVLSAQLAREVGFKAIRVHEDWDFFFRLESRGSQFVLDPKPLCIVEDANPVGRASAPQPVISLDWLESWQDRISPASYLGMRARIAPLLRKERPIVGLRFILEAWVKNAIGFWTLSALIGRLVHPGLRTIAYWLHGRHQRYKRSVI